MKSDSSSLILRNNENCCHFVATKGLNGQKSTYLSAFSRPRNHSNSTAGSLQTVFTHIFRGTSTYLLIRFPSNPRNSSAAVPKMYPATTPVRSLVFLPRFAHNLLNQFLDSVNRCIQFLCNLVCRIMQLGVVDLCHSFNLSFFTSFILHSV